MKTAVAACLLLIAGCRTARPAGSAFQPIRTNSAQEARAQLDRRAAAFTGARSIMRVRAITPGGTQSFRAQLHVPDRTQMEMVIYTPIGTTAAIIRATGDQITFESRVDASSFKGTAEDVARSFGFYGADLNPAETAMLLIGLPPRPDLNYDVTPTGLRGVTIADITVTFDPPVFPARRAVIVRGENRLEVEHLELVATSEPK